MVEAIVNHFCTCLDELGVQSIESLLEIFATVRDLFQLLQQIF